MTSKAVVPLLVAMMLLTGVCNTLFTKYQDMQCVADCHTLNPKKFEQPVIQTLQMFVGESGCWLVVLAGYLLRRARRSSSNHGNYQPVAGGQDGDDGLENPDEDEDEEIEEAMTGSQTLVDPSNVFAKPLIDGEDQITQRKPLMGWRVCVLALPAICDICGTTLMNAGLLFVAASIYQMTRGALVLFVGLFSVIFLKHKLSGWKWASLFIVVAGVAVVGLAGALEKRHTLPGDTTGQDPIHDALHLLRDTVQAVEEHTATDTVIGILMIAGGQVFTATQFVLEESIMERYTMDPIQVVGWEGVFGFLVTLLGIGVLHGAIGRTDAGRGGYFDAREGFSQGVQLLWAERHKDHFGHLSKHNRYLPDTFHMDGLAWSWMGELEMAANPWICPARIWYGTFQRHHSSPDHCPSAQTSRKRHHGWRRRRAVSMTTYGCIHDNNIFQPDTTNFHYEKRTTRLSRLLRTFTLIQCYIDP
nr:uncharacterized protein c12g12.12 [Quercus suber]